MVTVAAHSEIRETRMERTGGPEEGAEGYLDYWFDDDKRRIMTGYLCMNYEGILALLQLLSTGHEVVIRAHGHVFYRRKAIISSVGWNTRSHPDHEDEITDLGYRTDLPLAEQV